MPGWESLAIKLAAVAAGAGLLYALVRAYGRSRAAGGAGDARARSLEADAEARQRFDTATGRPLSDDLAELTARQRARRERRGLRPPTADE